MAYPEPIRKLISGFDTLPGIGVRTAERLAFYVLRMAPEQAYNLARAIADVHKNVRACSRCCTVAIQDLCPICADATRDRATLLVVERPNDVESYEASGYRGLYHVLGGALNPIDGVEPEHLTVDRLVGRVKAGGVGEVILGVDPDFEGDGTALYVIRELKGLPVRITRIARGVPAGSAVEYSNGAILAEAVQGRRDVEDGR